MYMYKLIITCESCNGTGEAPLGEDGALIPCTACGTDGVRDYGTVEGAEEIVDLTDKVNDIKEKVDEIMDKLNE